jgi:hypothetical protein
MDARPQAAHRESIVSRAYVLVDLSIWVSAGLCAQVGVGLSSWGDPWIFRQNEGSEDA